MTTWTSSLFLGAGEWSSLITLVVLAVFSGISSYLQRRAAKREEENTVVGPAEPLKKTRVPEPEAVEDWEAELRRLLGQPPPRESARPPILPSQPPTPAAIPSPKPAPYLVRRPPPVAVPVLDEEGPDLKLPPLVESRSVLEQASSLNDQVTERLHRISGGLGRMTESSAALGEVAQFGQGVHRHVEEGIARSRNVPVAHTQKELSPQAAAIVELLRSRKGAQQAILASLVLGPPKGLEFPR